MNTTMADLKAAEKDLAAAIKEQREAGNMAAVVELSKALGAVELTLAQFEAANDLMDDVEELLEKHGMEE